MASNTLKLPPLDLVGANPEPLLHCRWCLAPVRADDLHTVVFPLTGPFERKDLSGETISLVIDGTPVDVFVPTSFEGHGYAGSSVVNFACSVRCQRDLRRCYAAAGRPDVQTRRRWFGAASPELESVRKLFAFGLNRGAVPDRDPATLPILDERSRRRYERQLRNRCGYCLVKIKTGAPGVAVSATGEGHSDRSDLARRRLVVVDVGGRPLAGYVPRPGSDLTPVGEIVFLMCSEACVAAFTADIRWARVRRSLH